MYKNHEIFTQAAKENRKIILTYYSGTQKLYLTKKLIPVRYRHSDSERNSDVYYFWDSKAKSNKMLVLSSSNIKSMELSEEGFGKADCFILKNGKGH